MQKKTINNEVVSKTLLGCIIGVSTTVAIVFLVLFLLNREWRCDWPIDNSLLGTYGDFIGGVIGTVIAFYSAYLLVRTFQNQTKVNESVIATNNVVKYSNEKELYNSLLQIFNNKFNRFMDAYLKSVDMYGFADTTENGVKKGRDAFEKLAKTFLAKGFNNANDYYRRNTSAVSEYESFYSNNSIYLSVHFRMLYLLVSLISKSGLSEEDKVLYAKLVRGQLSEFEMLLLHYNCYSEYGEKMQVYCNEFNLVKHLPVMQLLEFKRYYNHLYDVV